MLRLVALIFAFFLMLDDAYAQSSPAPSRHNASASSMSPLEKRAHDTLAILNGDPGAKAMFAPVFLDAVPFDQVEEISRQFTKQFGPALEVIALSPPTGLQSVVTIRMERAQGQIALTIEDKGQHRITGLRLLEFTPLGDSVESVTADLNALDGKVSAYFGPLDGAQPILSLNPQAQRPLGSAMKLYVLGALGAQIARGERAWSDEVPLTTKSFPSGEMQDWALGTPVTLRQLASHMISISDNTATDQLIAVLGRETIEQYLVRAGHSDVARNVPWINTRQLFEIKGSTPDRIKAYIDGSPDQRLALLKTIAQDPPTLEQINAKLVKGPVAIETVEWFANASDLARLFITMRAEADPEVFRIMAINPALPPSVINDWAYVGFKGGSETGVLNMTWLLVDKRGREHLLMLSWSNPDQEVETETLLLLAQRIVSLPR